MKKEAWRATRRIEEEFSTSLSYLSSLFGKICDKTGSDQAKYTERMENFQKSRQFERYIYSSVKRMVTPLARGNFDTWRKVARLSTKNPFVYRTLLKNIKDGIERDIAEQIEENVQLIRTLPSDVARKVVYDIRDFALAGERATTIAWAIKEKTGQHARASARLIARTEVSKTTTALTKARAVNLRIMWYIWRTAEDGDRVRKSHRNMEGVLVNWNTPPSPELLVGEKNEGYYHAGNIWNCRCYPEPIVDFDEVKFPRRVYWNGSVKSMNKREFEATTGAK